MSFSHPKIYDDRIPRARVRVTRVRVTRVRVTRVRVTRVRVRFRVRFRATVATLRKAVRHRCPTLTLTLTLTLTYAEKLRAHHPGEKTANLPGT